MPPTAARSNGSLNLRGDWLPSVLMGVVSLVTAVTFFYLAVFFKQTLGFTGTEIGLLFAINAVTGVLITLPAGLVNDRLTSRSLVAIGLAVQALCLAGLALVRDFWAVAGVYWLYGLSSGLFKLSLDVQVLKTDSGLRTGSRLGLYQALRFGGVGIGLVLTGVMLLRWTFEDQLLMVAAACLLLTGLAFWLVPTRVARLRFSDYRADLGQRRVLFFAAWLFLFSSHWGAEATSYGLFLRENLKLGLDQMGWYMSGEFFTITVTLVVAGRMLKGLEQLRTYALIGLLASGIGQIGMIFEPLALSLAFRSLHGAGDGLMFLVMYFGIARLFAIERLGGNTGFIGMASMLGYVAGALIYGPLGESHGYHVPLWTSGLTVILLALGLRMVPGRTTTPAA